MEKIITFEAKAREKLFSGIEKLSKAVEVTLGPKGKNVAIRNDFGVSQIINDGVSIAKEIELEDEIENMGAELLKEVALKTNDIAGDGTTTATVLAYNMVKEGMKNIASGANPVEIRKGMNIAKDIAIDCINNISESISSNNQIKEIASISAGDSFIGNIIYQGIDKVGKDGVVTIEESKTTETKLNVLEGFRVDSGYISSYMVRDDGKNMEEMNNPFVLILNKEVSNFQEILPVIEKVAPTNRPLLLIVEDMDSDALANVLLNKVRGTFNSIAIKSPSFGKVQEEILEDIAYVTNTKVYDSNSISELKNIELKDLGIAKTIKVYKEQTVIFPIDERKEEIQKRIEVLNKDKENNARVKRLSGKVAQIEVGAATQTELIEKKLRIEDALSATQAALKEGIVPGSAKAYIIASKKIGEIINELSGDEKIGANIVKVSLEKPLYVIARNAGVNADIVLEKVKETKNLNDGYDASTNTFGDLRKKGIIDPTKVEKTALENAVSISSLLITTDCAIATKKTKGE